MLYIPRGLYHPEGGAVRLALPVGVGPLEEGQSVFYQGPRVREQLMVTILYPYLTVLPGELPSGETHVGSQDPCKYSVLTRFLKVCCVPPWGDPC